MPTRRIGFAAVILLAALASCTHGGQDEEYTECTEAEPIAGSPDDYTEPAVADGIDVAEPIACDEGMGCRVVSLQRDGEHPVRFGSGCVRCESGRFVELDEREVRSNERDEIFTRACEEGTHTAADGCEIFSDMFLGEISTRLAGEDVRVIGQGLSCLDRERSMLMVHDYGHLGPAVEAVAEAMETWDVDDTVDVAVCEIPGECLLEG